MKVVSGKGVFKFNSSGVTDISAPVCKGTGNVGLYVPVSKNIPEAAPERAGNMVAGGGGLAGTFSWFGSRLAGGRDRVEECSSGVAGESSELGHRWWKGGKAYLV